MESKTNIKDRTLTNKKLRIGIFILIILFCAFGVGVYYLSKPVVINLNDYVFAKTEGYSGVGTFELYIDWDLIKEKYGSKITKKEECRRKNEEENLDDIIDKLKSTTRLAHYIYGPFMDNGSVIDYQFKTNQGLINQLKCKIVYSDGSYTLEGFKEPEEVDFFSMFNEPYITFSGLNGETEAHYNCDFKDGEVLLNNGDLIVKTRIDYTTTSDGDYVVDVYYKDEVIDTLWYSVYDNSFLKNGDISALSIRGLDDISSCYVVPKENNIEFVVDERPELLTDLSSITSSDIKQCYTDLTKERDLANLDDYEYIFYDDGSKLGCKKDYFEILSIGNAYLATPKDSNSELKPFIFAEFSYIHHYDYDYRYLKGYPNYDFVITNWQYDGIAEFRELYFEDGKLKHRGGYYGIAELYFADFTMDGKLYSMHSMDDYLQIYCKDYDITPIK